MKSNDKFICDEGDNYNRTLAALIISVITIIMRRALHANVKPFPLIIDSDFIRKRPRVRLLNSFCCEITLTFASV